MKAISIYAKNTISALVGCFLCTYIQSSNNMPFRLFEIWSTHFIIFNKFSWFCWLIGRSNGCYKRLIYLLLNLTILRDSRQPKSFESLEKKSLRLQTGAQEDHQPLTHLFKRLLIFYANVTKVPIHIEMQIIKCIQLIVC